MKRISKKVLPVLLALVVACGSIMAVGCKSSEPNMFERKKTNKGATVKSNIKVKGSNKTNGHTTRSY